MRKIVTRKQLLRKLRIHLPELSRKYSIKSLGIFGSYSHDKQKKGSDVDLLVEFNRTPGLFTFVEMENELSDLLGVKVDLVSRGGLSPYLKDRILSEVRPVYGQG